MKVTNIFKITAIVALSLLLSTSMLAQEKPEATPEKKECESKLEKKCCAKKTAEECKTKKHTCTEECKTAGCDAVKAKECKDAKAKKCKTEKHVCTEECKTAGCDAVKAKECKAAKEKHCKTDKAKECKDKDGEAKTKECKDGAKYECPMKCEPASHKPGECSKCGMELKKVEKE
ncbi:MAG: hypothetical protein L3J41_15400 [Melioribacteraceae bacterium]|nr:hypothetical protein [Melioribacteraceae bacterium]